METKKVLLRAFRCPNTKVGQATNNLIEYIENRLEESSLKDRRMTISEKETTQDVLSYYSQSENNSYVFGQICRIAPTEEVASLPSDFFDQSSVNVEEIDSVVSESGIVCKDYYYFYLTNSFLITALLQKGTTIKRFQTYINWFIESQISEKEDLFTFSEMVKKPDNLQMLDIKKIAFKDSCLKSVSNNNTVDASKKFDIKNLLYLFDPLFNGIDSLKEIIDKEIISANLFISFKKPKGMSAEDYKKQLSAMITPMCDHDDIEIVTKKGTTIKGTTIIDSKPIDVSLTDGGNIEIEELKQAMRTFLKEVADRNDD